MDATARPTGPAQSWAELPKITFNDGALALGKEQMVIAVTEEASELWLVEFPER